MIMMVKEYDFVSAINLNIERRQNRYLNTILLTLREKLHNIVYRSAAKVCSRAFLEGWHGRFEFKIDVWCGNSFCV